MVFGDSAGRLAAAGGEALAGAGRAGRRAFARVQAFGRRGTSAVLDVLYPPQCLGCGRATGSTAALCAPCWHSIGFITRPFCERLGTPFAQDLGPGLLSPEAIAHPPVFARARAVALFDEGAVQRLVHRLKYGDRHEVARLLGALMARPARELAADAPVLVPMPLHRGRLLRRQFNQAGLLADELGRRLILPVDHGLLGRTKATRTQVGMTRDQRARNVLGAFAVPAGRSAAGRPVLLVDDVLTTGATANAAARALLRGGAPRVDLVVFARVAGPSGLAIYTGHAASQ